MNNCLITNLKHTVNDENLCGLNELRLDVYFIYNPNMINKRIFINNGKGSTVTIRTTGIDYIYDVNNNKIGQSLTGLDAYFAMTEEEHYQKIFIYNKNDIKSIRFNSTTFLNNDLKTIIALPNITDFILYGGKPGDLSEIYNPNITFLGLRDCNLTGVLTYNHFNKNAVTEIHLSTKEKGSIYIDLSIFEEVSTLLAIDIRSCSVTGNISSLCNNKNLYNLYLCTVYDEQLVEYIDVSCDISMLADLQNLTIINGLKGCNVYGDLSKIGDNKLFFSAYGINNIFTWTERSTSAIILALEEVKLGDYVDTMLINQAQCVDPQDYSNEIFRIISVHGTRTSASDEAVASLKAMGYTIKVNNIVL